jgi:pyocin large subunit-like protein
MSRTTFILIGSIFIALITFGLDKFYSLKSDTQQNVQSVTVYDTSQIWSRGPSGNAAVNATKHFKKHGRDFGFKTEQEYVAAAIKFTTDPLSPDVLTNIQKDNDMAYYNPRTAEYAVKSKSGYIRTYFRLNPRIHGYASNTDYFNAQAKVGSQPPANDNSRKSSY